MTEAADEGTALVLALERTFRDIERERMAGLAVHNPRLSVEALPGRLWDGRWLTVLITPWCMNLLLLPAAGGGWRSGSGQQRLFYKFPAGDFAFLCAAEAGLGEYQSCALFSSMGEFADQESARATAAASLEALLRSPAPGRQDGSKQEQNSLSRRAFLFR